MGLSRATVGLAVCAAGAGAVLGHGLAPMLARGAVGGGSFALVRYEGWLSVIFAHLVCLAAVAGITRLGSSKSIGPNAQLQIFHDANALCGVALALALHGSGAAWPLAFLFAGKLLVKAAQALRLRHSVAAAAVWSYAACALLVNNSFQGAGAAFWCQHLLGAASAAAWLPLAQRLDNFVGVAPVHYTVGIAFRYTLMRYVSWALDTLSGRVATATSTTAVDRAYAANLAGPGATDSESPRIGAAGGLGTSSFEHLAMLSAPDSPQKVHAVSQAGLESATWPAFLSYCLFAPCYLAGPLLTAADYFQQAAAACAGRCTTRSLSGRTWWRAVARLAGFVAFVEALRRASFADHVVQSLLAAQPWQAFAAGYCVLTALFAQSFIPWTFARLCAGLLGIAPVDEAPVGFLRSSVTPRTFWRNFHVSWYRWLKAYIYIPLGGSTAGLVAAIAASTLLHGTHRVWLTWGAIQCAALLAEGYLRGRKASFSRLPPHLRSTLVQCATQTTLLVQLPLGPSLPLFLACFHAVNLPFCMLNAARQAARQHAAASPGKLFGQHLKAKTAAVAGGAKVAWE